MTLVRQVFASAVISLAMFGIAQTLRGQSASQNRASDAILVTPENFVCAESDLYFGGVVKNGGFGKFDHTCDPAPLDKQTVIRLNRDTLSICRTPMTRAKRVPAISSREERNIGGKKPINTCSTFPTPRGIA